MHNYCPPNHLRGGHRMTLYAWACPRRFPRLSVPVPRYFDVSSDTRVLGHCHWKHEPKHHPTLIALHGLEGSSRAHYMVGLADKAFLAGFNVIRLNQRNCGGTEHLSPGLYHSGLTEDPAAVLKELIEVDKLSSFVVVGYSLGGNLAVKLAGDYGDCAPPQLHAVCAISPTLDLERCVTALDRRENFAYQWNFVRNLKRRIRQKARLFPQRYTLGCLGKVTSVREFDEQFTAPHHNFLDANDYYYRASALRVTQKIRVPTLILSAKDDPFVPPEQFKETSLLKNPHVSIVITRYGGHCGFIAVPHNDDGYWAERRAIEFARRNISQPKHLKTQTMD